MGRKKEEKLKRRCDKTARLFWNPIKKGSLSNRIGEELLGEALTVVTQLMLLFDLREKYNQCD